MHHGYGEPVTAKTKTVSFHHSYHIAEGDDSVSGYGTVTNGSLTLLLPGVAHALMGMRPGEKREVYIHPDYGYHEDRYHPTQVVLSTTIELLQCVKGDEIVSLNFPGNSRSCGEEALFEPYRALLAREDNDMEVLLERYRKQRSKELYNNGIELAKYLSEKKHRIDIKQVAQALRNSSLSPGLIDDESKNRFLLALFSKDVESNAQQEGVCKRDCALTVFQAM